MPETALQAVFRLLSGDPQNLCRLAAAAAKDGSISVLQEMLGAGAIKPSGDRDFDVEFFASVLPILGTHPDRAAGQKVVEDVRAALGGFGHEAFMQGFAALTDPSLIGPMIKQGANPNAWMHDRKSRREDTTALWEMLDLSRTGSVQRCLDFLAERDEVPLGSYADYVTGYPPVVKTLFDRLLDVRMTPDYAKELVVLRHLIDRQDEGRLPRSWSLAAGRALLTYARQSCSNGLQEIAQFGLIPIENRTSLIVSMARIAAFDDAKSWATLLTSPVRRGFMVFGHFLAYDDVSPNIALAITKAAMRDGLHPDQVVCEYEAGKGYTWLAGAVNMDAHELVQALLECGADPRYKAQPNGFSAAEDAVRNSATMSAQAVNSWLAKSAINRALQGARPSVQKEP